MRILSKTCNVVRERVLTVLMLSFALISVISVTIQHSLADTKSTTNLFISPTTKAVPSDLFTLYVVAESSIPVNVFAGTIQYDSSRLTVIGTNYQTSVADVWVEEPMADPGTGTIRFSGGSTDQGGFTGTGTLLSVTFRSLEVGTTTISLTNRQVLRHDGKGTEAALAATKDAVVTIMPPSEQVSAEANEPAIINRPLDLNHDGQYTFNDVGIYLEYLHNNDPRGDLNGNQLINADDLSLLQAAVQQ